MACIQAPAYRDIRKEYQPVVAEPAVAAAPAVAGESLPSSANAAPPIRGSGSKRSAGEEPDEEPADL